MTSSQRFARDTYSLNNIDFPEKIIGIYLNLRVLSMPNHLLLIFSD